LFRRHDLDRDSLDFWRRQRRAAQRSRGRGSFSFGVGGHEVTIVLLALLVLGLIAEYVLPLGLIAALPLGQLWLAVVSSFLPGGILGLIFVAIFVWMMGTQLEPLDAAWKYVLLFVLSGTLGSLAGDLAAGGLVGSVAAFGLAGGYAYVMWAHGWVDQAGVGRWVLGLLILNAILSLGNLASIVSMVVAFVAGFAFAYLTAYGS